VIEKEGFSRELPGPLRPAPGLGLVLPGHKIVDDRQPLALRRIREAVEEPEISDLPRTHEYHGTQNGQRQAAHDEGESATEASSRCCTIHHVGLSPERKAKKVNGRQSLKWFT
jgi:hypothetical protein